MTDRPKGDLGNQRRDYQLGTLRRADLESCPVKQFASWYADAERLIDGYPNPMILSTVDETGAPSARVVLLKSFDSQGFVFYTNYDSDKGNHIARNAEVSLVFFWEPLERQIRIRGKAEKSSQEAADAYFASRPRGSQLSAAASDQSKVVATKSVLEERVKKLEEQFEGQPVTRPNNWGGYLVRPSSLEFWQGRPDRLHDRFIYTQDSITRRWEIQRLSP